MTVPDATESARAAVASLALRDILALTERAPVGTALLDATGRCLLSNPAWQVLMGLSPAACLGLGWLEGVHEDDREAVRQRCAGLATTQNVRINHRTRHADGRVCPVVLRVWPMAGSDDGPVFVASMTDVTETMQVQRELRSTVTLLDRTGQIAGVGGWDIDLRTRRVRWTDQTFRIHERAPDWHPTIDGAIGHYAPEARPVIALRVERAIQHGEPFDVELPLVTATGRRLMVRAVGDVERVAGEPVRLYGALQDVTMQRQAAEEIRSSRERLRHLYDETPALMASTDASGTVLTVSRRLRERLGLASDSLIGAPAESLLAGDAEDRAEARHRVVVALRDPAGIRSLPLRLLHRDGSTVHTLLSAVAERGASGAMVRLLAVFEDISEAIRHRAELARERALREELQRQAQELARLADERREMLDVLAHEVRQPLNNASAALQGAASLGGMASEAESMRGLARAQGVISDVVAQIDNTLAAAALLVSGRRLERADTEIDTLLQLVLAELAPAERARIAVERLTPTRTASMDLSLMRLALRNLLSNALRHASADSPVAIRISDSDEPLALLLDVVDRGPGVAEAVRQRLFERGARGPASRGQGLGLYIARRALQLHGGTAELLASAPGETRFRLVLVQDEGDGYSTSGALNT